MLTYFWLKFDSNERRILHDAKVRLILKKKKHFYVLITSQYKSLRKYNNRKRNLPHKDIK